MDRRARKNREAIMNALIGLMAEKEFDKITINDIAERADVNRGTVYSHYADKYQLLDKCIETHLERLVESCMPASEEEGRNPAKTALLRAFELMEENRSFYVLLLTDRGLPAFRSGLQATMIQGVELTLERLVPENGLPVRRDVFTRFLSSAAVGVIEDWLLRSMPYSAEEISDQLWTMLELNLLLASGGKPVSSFLG